MNTMTDVLAGHQWYDATNDSEDPAIGCVGCDDWFGSEYALDDGTFAAHQAEMLAAAGFGLVREQQARLDAVRDLANWAGKHGWTLDAAAIRKALEATE